ncbi:radical SAM protein [Candidatus Thiosymbion oneisti]|uniref:radical SAM protein n=1 Tax=Candidatus Thiosymbion oneisti TaxID=589554 RepID=UPI000B0BA365|nr:radical SAM/SPASM domain-containing protein [Candidatus Thiosymbion oneisti]
MKDLRERELNPFKILHHCDRLQRLARGQDVVPVTVEIDPVAYCNHACGWCVDPIHEPVKMAWSTFERLTDELAGFRIAGRGVEGIVFKGGGEPSLHPEFLAMVRCSSDLGLAVGIVTNGSRLQGCSATLADHAAYVRVSIDGPTPDSHRRIHNSNDFDQILQGVSDLVSARENRRHPVIGLSFAMDIHSLDLAGAAIALGERLAVDYVLLRPPFFEEVGRAPTMSPAEAERVRQDLTRTAIAYQGALEVLVGNWVGDAEQGVEQALAPSGRRDTRVERSLPIEHRTGRCLASPLLAVVTADGTLYGCCNLRALPDWAMGRLDYAAGVGFAQLWRSKRRREVLARMHRTACIRHCTHPLARYNELIEVLRDSDRPHSQFV